MSLSDLASIGTVVSGVAVLASLVYLALQIRQSEKNQRAQLNQGTVTRNVDILMFQSQPHINALGVRVTAGDEDFSPEELALLHLRLRGTLLANQDTYLQHEAGLVDRVTYENSIAVLRYLFSQSVYKALWRISRSVYAHEYADFVERITGDVPIAAAQDSVAHFKVVLADVKAQA